MIDSSERWAGLGLQCQQYYITLTLLHNLYVYTIKYVDTFPHFLPSPPPPTQVEPPVYEKYVTSGQIESGSGTDRNSRVEWYSAFLRFYRFNSEKLSVWEPTRLSFSFLFLITDTLKKKILFGNLQIQYISFTSKHICQHFNLFLCPQNGQN